MKFSCASPRGRADLCHPALLRNVRGTPRDNVARYLGVGRTTIEALRGPSLMPPKRTPTNTAT